MGRTSSRIGPAVAAWLGAQQMFFVATAPSDGGHVNVSPKGLDTLRVIGPHEVRYLDLTGSGVETIAHVRDNGRITLMFCAFSGPPRIVRLYGTGRVTEVGEDRYDELAADFPAIRGARAVITVEVDRVSDSCGYAVPLFEFVAQRSRLVEWAGERSDQELVEYRAEKNTSSIDGLPGFARGEPPPSADEPESSVTEPGPSGAPTGPIEPIGPTADPAAEAALAARSEPTGEQAITTE